MKPIAFSLLLLFTLSVVAQSAKDLANDLGNDDRGGDEWSSDDKGSDDEWGDSQWDVVESPWSHAGFIEWAQGERLQSDDLFGDQTTLSEIRWHHQFDYSHDQFKFNWSHDVWFDAVPDSDTAGLLFDLRELNFQFSLGQRTDVVLGRQISTWGTGDLLFINDLFPKDWVSFFSGRDDTYLKAPADALRISHYQPWANWDLVITPRAEPDRFINGERFALFSPMAQSLVGGGEIINPKNSNEAEYALRLFKNLNGHQLALYAYHGIEKSPVGIHANNQPYHPRKNVWGASYQNTFGKGLLKAEIGYHQSLEDRRGSNPAVPNSQWRALVGYERELYKKLNWGVQYYLEHTTDHSQLLAQSPTPQFEPEQNRHVVTNRLTYQAMQDKLTWSLFVFYSPTDQDSYWRPSVNYRHNDQWQFTFGGNVFTGQENHTFFGQFEEASNLYARIRWQF